MVIIKRKGGGEYDANGPFFQHGNGDALLVHHSLFSISVIPTRLRGGFMDDQKAQLDIDENRKKLPEEKKQKNKLTPEQSARLKKIVKKLCGC